MTEFKKGLSFSFPLVIQETLKKFGFCFYQLRKLEEGYYEQILLLGNLKSSILTMAFAWKLSSKQPHLRFIISVQVSFMLVVSNARSRLIRC
jgi:hypothetical protein